MPQEQPDVVAYRVDAHDRISSVNGEWLRFAQENDASELTPERVVGRPLQHFVDGDEVLALWGVIMRRVRASGQPMQIPFRCDSPDRRRFMEMTLSPVPGQELEFTCRLIRSEPREPVAVLDPNLERSGHWLTMCAWCNRFLVSDAIWLEAEDAVRRMRLLARTVVPKLTGGICPRCLDAFTGGSAPEGDAPDREPREG